MNLEVPRNGNLALIESIFIPSLDEMLREIWAYDYIFPSFFTLIFLII